MLPGGIGMLDLSTTSTLTRLGTLLEWWEGYEEIACQHRILDGANDEPVSQGSLSIDSPHACHFHNIPTGMYMRNTKVRDDSPIIFCQFSERVSGC